MPAALPFPLEEAIRFENEEGWVAVCLAQSSLFLCRRRRRRRQPDDTRLDPCSNFRCASFAASDVPKEKEEKQ